MLGKLLKYEFRATGRVFLPMYALLLVMSVAARLFYAGGLRKAFNGGMTEARITVIVTMIMVMLFTAVWVITLAIILRRFWRNILGREGYLMNVLPVNPWEHLLSKSVVSAVWVLLGGIVSAAALCIMADKLIFGSIQWDQFLRMWNDAWEGLRRAGVTDQVVLLIVQVIVNFLLQIFGFILSAYAAMCIGQTVNRHRVWASIGAYFGISIVHSILNTMLMSSRSERLYDFGVTGYFFSFGGTQREMLAAANKDLLLYLLLSLAVCAALFYLSQWLLKKKLNLQ